MVHFLPAHQLTSTLLLQMWLFSCLPLNCIFHIDAYLLRTRHSRAVRRYQQETHCFETAPSSTDSSPTAFNSISSLTAVNLSSSLTVVDSTSSLIAVAPILESVMDSALGSWLSWDTKSFHPGAGGHRGGVASAFQSSSPSGFVVDPAISAASFLSSQ